MRIKEMKNWLNNLFGGWKIRLIQTYNLLVRLSIVILLKLIKKSHKYSLISTL